MFIPSLRPYPSSTSSQLSTTTHQNIVLQAYHLLSPHFPIHTSFFQVSPNMSELSTRDYTAAAPRLLQDVPEIRVEAADSERPGQQARSTTTTTAPRHGSDSEDTDATGEATTTTTTRESTRRTRRPTLTFQLPAPSEQQPRLHPGSLYTRDRPPTPNPTCRQTYFPTIDGRHPVLSLWKAAAALRGIWYAAHL